jgi:hypothetical protein
LATKTKRKFQIIFHIFLRNGFQNGTAAHRHIYSSVLKRPRTNPRRAPSRRGREHRARKIRGACAGGRMRRARRRGVHRVLALLGHGATRRTGPSQHSVCVGYAHLRREFRRTFFTTGKMHATRPPRPPVPAPTPATVRVSGSPVRVLGPP